MSGVAYLLSFCNFQFLHPPAPGNETISTMTAPEAEDAAIQDDLSTISASEAPQMEIARNPPGTINPSAEDARINAGNLDWMKAHVSEDFFLAIYITFLTID